MKYTKIIKSLSIILVIVLITGIMPNRQVNAKSIYFSGEYVDEKNDATLEMNEYSSYDSGKEVGNFSIIAYGGKATP